MVASKTKILKDSNPSRSSLVEMYVNPNLLKEALKEIGLGARQPARLQYWSGTDCWLAMDKMDTWKKLQANKPLRYKYGLGGRKSPCHHRESARAF
jgi:hypothetical protein